MFKNISIGHKLTIGFGLLIILTMFNAAVSFLANADAVATIKQVKTIQAPAVLASAHAEADVLRMFADIQGYIIVGDPRILENYRQSEQHFQQDIQTLEQLALGFDSANQQRVNDIETTFIEWQTLSTKLLNLYNDQAQREPAYAWLSTTGNQQATTIINTTSDMMEIQATRTPSLENSALLKDMALFQQSFTALFGGLRGYVTTRDADIRVNEYEASRATNDEVWQRLHTAQTNLTAEQQTMLNTIETNRTAFLDQIPDNVLTIMESNRSREDLLLFGTEIVPLTEQFQEILGAMAESQQSILIDGLNRGSGELQLAQADIVIGELIIVVVGIAMAFMLWRIIVRPLHNLTAIADRIRAGDVHTRAPANRRDEIGTFAATFNMMTEQLQQQMEEIRQEKQTTAELQQEIIRSQETLLHELSTPLFPLADKVVAMPLIGAIDSMRAEQMMQTLLRGVSEHKAKIAILDITGVSVVDTQVASALIRTAQAVSLLGTKVVITGIRADVAQTLVHIGVDLQDIVTHATFQDGIAYALNGRTS